LRIDAGTFTLHVDRQNLADLVATTLRKFERRLDGHDLRQQIHFGRNVRDLFGKKHFVLLREEFV